MKKGLICTICILSIIAALFTGCGTKNEATAAPDNSTVEGSSTAVSNAEDSGNKKTTLRFFWWGSDKRHKATLDTINLYMEKNPNIAIEAEYQGWDSYFQKLTTQLASGVAADILQVDPPWVHDLSANGKSFMDLLQYKDIIDISGFDNQFLKDYGYIDDKLYALPCGVNAYTMLINTELLKSAGIDTSSSWDWDRLLTEGKKLHEKDKECYLLSCPSGLYAEVILKGYMMQKCGKQWINADCTLAFNKEQLTDALTYVKKLYDEGVAEPLGESELYNGKENENPKWMKKQVGAHITWTSMIGVMKDALGEDADITSFPIAKDAENSGVMIRPSMLLSINKKTAHGSEAAKFLNFFFNDKEAALTLKDTRSIPAVASSRETLIEANLLDKLTAKATDIALANPAEPDNAVSANEELKTIFADTVSNVVFGKMTPDKAAGDMITRFEDKLEELKSSN